MKGDRCIYWLLYGVVRLLSFIPFHAGQSLGRVLGRSCSLLLGERLRVSREAMQRVFGERLSDGQIRLLHRKLLEHFGQMVFEVPHILRLNRNNLHRYVVFQNTDVLDHALRQGKGAFILTAHFGNWELMSASLSLHLPGKKGAVVRPVDFRPADQIISLVRSRFGTEVIPKKRAMKRLLNGVRENMLMGILLDQNVDWYEGVFVLFLQGLACTNKGLALLAMKTGTPVIPMFSVREPDGRFRVICEEPIPISHSGDKIRDIEDNTQSFTRVIERYVLRYPDHWFWFHRRWKTRPFCPLPPDFYDRTEPKS